MKLPVSPVLVVGAVLLLSSLATPIRAATMILHNFTGGVNDGIEPYGSLTVSGSKLYGMTQYGGSSERGVAFSMNTDGTGFSLLHSFIGGTSDGRHPYDSLTLSGSKLYGMTEFGGSSNNGAIFSMNTDGTGFGLLHSFSGGLGDGATPRGSLTLSGSKLYGMASNGGSNLSNGVIFSVNTDGTGYTVVHTFTGNPADGSSPYGSLTLSGSKLYGMTFGGGSGNAGTIFRVNTDGTGFGLLHSFSVSTDDGYFPTGSLTLSGSKLYGMTSHGGSSDDGVAFSVNTDGTGFSLLHSFSLSTSDGRIPYGSLTLFGSTLYGMTEGGGSSGQGTLFSIGTDGTGFNLLESFGGAPDDGFLPFADLSISADGSTLYGMTHQGGTANGGVVFSAPAPEPGACALLGLGAFLISARRRKTRA